ncbi:MAG: hypothetical protein AB1898_25880 [Acidobacteriota bacterium]
MSDGSDQATVARLRLLNAADPQSVIDELDRQVSGWSVKQLAAILEQVYADLGESLIDWSYTALQWKMGNTGRGDFPEAIPPSRFVVWSFPFFDGDVQTRYSTCLPFQFKDEVCIARTDTLAGTDSSSKGWRPETEGDGGRYRI